jgi:hypothetical protein
VGRILCDAGVSVRSARPFRIAIGSDRRTRIWSMIKRVLFAALIFAAPVRLVSAQDAKVSVDMIGIGSMSCAHWRSTQEHLLEGTIWIYGFWTGLNYVAAASGQTQAKIHDAAIGVKVEKTCAQQKQSSSTMDARGSLT